MSEPDFMICMQCDTPCYLFEWNDDSHKLQEALCPICGNEDLDEFQTEEEYMGEE